MGLHVVTGAFGYTGRHIASRLLAMGRQVRTLTNTPARGDAVAGRVEARPLDFADPAALAESLRGADVLYNTYWVRFTHGSFSHAQAVENSRRLWESAARAGVARIVHISITNPSDDSRLDYFRGKAQVERALRESGLSHAIIRPALLFGGNGILINNIAWALRRFPVFAVFGDGRYRLRPIHVDDLAALAVEHGQAGANVTCDAVGPETWTYRELVEVLGGAIGHPRPVIGVPPFVAYAVGKLIGWWMRDVFITRDEIAGLMAGLLWTPAPATGTVRLSEWAAEHRDALGRTYASELARRKMQQM